jgi:hypothetical protein
VLKNGGCDVVPIVYAMRSLEFLPPDVKKKLEEQRKKNDDGVNFFYQRTNYNSEQFEQVTMCEIINHYWSILNYLCIEQKLHERKTIKS